MKKILCWTMFFSMVFILGLVSAQDQKQEKRSQVEVVFVLDTTGSMGGLISGAQQKVWSIVNEIARGKPSPVIKVGLVGYRDKGDEYITKIHPLTEDLDSMYEKLMAFQAGGGGDGPEHVNQALYDGVTKMTWSDDINTLKIIFLVGDAPPHMDYTDDVKYQKTCEMAVKKGIVINTIRCGTWDETGRYWKEIADLGEGDTITIEQSGGTVAVKTPYDDELSSLSTKLSSTYVGYGKASEREEMKSKMDASDKMPAAPEATASRAEYRAKKLAEGGGLGGKDLVSEYEKDKGAATKISKEELPPEIKNLPQEKIDEYLKKQLEERKKIQTEIEGISKKRAEYLKNEQSKGTKDSFDSIVLKTIKKQAAKKGISYE